MNRSIILKEERLLIYKKALSYINNADLSLHKSFYNNADLLLYKLFPNNADLLLYKLFPNNAGLCLLLPCIWLNLNSYLDNYIDENGIQFSFSETILYFPEFSEYYYNNGFNIKYDTLYYNNTVEWRIKILNEIINKLENE